jgi:hypothetical protein
MATKAQRHKAKLFVKINLRALVSWWRKCFGTKSKEMTFEDLTLGGKLIQPKYRVALSPDK